MKILEINELRNVVVKMKNSIADQKSWPILLLFCTSQKKKKKLSTLSITTMTSVFFLLFSLTYFAFGIIRAYLQSSHSKPFWIEWDHLKHFYFWKFGNFAFVHLHQRKILNCFPVCDWLSSRKRKMHWNTWHGDRNHLLLGNVALKYACTNPCGKTVLPKEVRISYWLMKEPSENNISAKFEKLHKV